MSRASYPEETAVVDNELRALDDERRTQAVALRDRYEPFGRARCERNRMSIRDARADDLSEIRSILRHHAESEGGIVPADDDELKQALFGAAPVVYVAIAETEGTLAGLAMWYPTFSSWALRSGIWLEDLYVKPEFRKAGVGRELMLYLRGRTEGRIEWDVSDGNDRAHRFYRRLGAAHLDGFARYRWPATTSETRPGS